MTRKFALLFATFLLGYGSLNAEPLKVASLHPLLSDMAQEIGGDCVELHNLLDSGSNLHSFEPSTAQLAAAAQAKLLLACGKNTEPYLRKLRASLPAHTRIIELGKDIPDVYIPGSKQADPHWWNNPENMKRASLSLLQAFIQADPGNKDEYIKRQKVYARLMDKLLRQAKIRITRIPVEKRVLVTGHAAMCHFCHEFGFISVPLFGIAAESEGDTASLAIILQQLRKRNIKSIFNESSSSPKLLDTISEQIGAKTHSIIMDGLHPKYKSFEQIFSYNLNTILKGLGSEVSTSKVPAT